MAERFGQLQLRLRATESIAGCAQLVCDHLVELGYPLVSLYLCRSDRLRCFGASGYSQVLDGFPALAGVISATVCSGEPHVIDVATSDLYMEAASSVVAEVCVPIQVDVETIGALNIESPRPMGPETLTIASEVAALFASRLTELGGLPQPTGWMYLADQAARLVQFEDLDRLFETALDVAVELSGADSGMFAIGNRSEGFRAVASSGSLGTELTSLPEESLREIGHWVDGPLSCYSWGTPDGEWFSGFDQLREAGLGALVVVALVRGSDQLGYFVTADRRGSRPSTELVEQLELLGSLVSSAIANAQHLSTLRELARRDPLTGLGHHVAFGERLHSIHDRHPTYAVLAIDVDHFKSVNDTYGHEHGDRVLQDLAQAMSAAIRADDALFRTGGDEFAAVVAVASRQEALGLASRLEEAARRLGTPVSIGVAISDAGDGTDLYAKADEALYRAKAAGRNVTVLAGAPISRSTPVT